MAERRMFAKAIVLSDAFLDMPPTARCLYFTLSMFADDDGFVNNPKGIMRQSGACEDDIKILLAKKFLLAFESGVIVIKHWRINNYLRNDRYKETKYAEERKQLTVKENGSYSFGIPAGIPSIGKDSIDKYSIEEINIDSNTSNIVVEEEQQQTTNKKFIKPSIEEIKSYCSERNNSVDANYFFDYYESKGWKIGKNPMKDWKAAVRTWERKDFNKGGDNNTGTSTDSRRNPNESKYSRANGWF